MHFSIKNKTQHYALSSNLSHFNLQNLLPISSVEAKISTLLCYIVRYPTSMLQSPQLIAYAHPHISAIPRILKSIPEGENHYFFGLLMKATRTSLSQIVDMHTLPKEIRLNPTLFHLEEHEFSHDMFHLLKREKEYGAQGVELEYVKKAFTHELFARLAKANSPLQRQQIFEKYSTG